MSHDGKILKDSFGRFYLCWLFFTNYGGHRVFQNHFKLCWWHCYAKRSGMSVTQMFSSVTDIPKLSSTEFADLRRSKRTKPVANGLFFPVSHPSDFLYIHLHNPHDLVSQIWRLSKPWIRKLTGRCHTVSLAGPRTTSTSSLSRISEFLFTVLRLPVFILDICSQSTKATDENEDVRDACRDGKEGLKDPVRQVRRRLEEPWS